MADNFDNYSMKVQARVDLPSNKDIDAQIRKLEKSISKLKVSGQFDDNALRNLTNQLNTLKASITTANFSPTALTELTNQVNRALQNINIGNINVGNIGNQARQAGQQIGNIVSDEVNNALGKVTSKEIGIGFTVEKTADGTFERVILIDNAFKETVNLKEYNYTVEVIKQGWGDYRIKEQTSDYFIVESDREDFTFKYIITGRRKGYENVRLEECFYNEEWEVSYEH